MILLMVVAEPLFVILFSDKWLESVPYFRILCIAGIVNCSQSVNYQVTAAVGRSQAIFRWNVIKRIVGLMLVFVGMYWGVEGILWAVVFGSYFVFVVNALVAAPSTGYTLQKQVKDSIPCLMLASVSALFVYPIEYLCEFSNMPLLLLQSIVYIIIYISLARIFGLQEFNEIVEIIKPYIKRK